MANNTIEIENVRFGNGEWLNEVVEVEFTLKSKKEEEDDESVPEISGTVSYTGSYPHGASLKVLNAKLATAFAEVADCLSEWSDDALEEAKIGRKR